MKEYDAEMERRKNELSWEEGGFVLSVEKKKNNKKFIVNYNNVKYPRKYIESMIKNNIEGEILSVRIKGEFVWTKSDGFKK